MWTRYADILFSSRSTKTASFLVFYVGRVSDSLLLTSRAMSRLLTLDFFRLPEASCQGVFVTVELVYKITSVTPEAELGVGPK